MRLLTSWDFMKRFQPKVFLSLSRFSGVLGVVAADRTMWDLKDKVIEEDIRPSFSKMATEIEGDCADLGLTASVASIRKIRALCDRPSPTYGELRKLYYEELHDRLIDEMSASLLLTVAPGRARLYNEPDLFGPEMASRFPSAADDIAEAGRCLALERATACVFHLMRVMECALRALAVSLKDPDLDPKRNPSWDAMLKKCRAQLALSLAERSPEWRGDDQFFSAATERLMAVKDAWRNPTMHVEKKYTEEEAEDAWNATRAFMRQVATKLHE